MKKLLLALTIMLFFAGAISAAVIQKTYQFSNPQITSIDGYHQISFKNTMLTGHTGEPMLPYHAVSLLLPPGHAAKHIEIIPGGLIQLEGNFTLYPMQYSQPMSKGGSGIFVLKEEVYQTDAAYPAKPEGEITTQFMNGYALAMTTFTPVVYNPVSGEVSYYSSVTVKITTKSDESAQAALQNLRTNRSISKRLEDITQNAEAISSYPAADNRTDDYDMLIISPTTFATGFEQLIEFYVPRGIMAQIATTDDIYATMPGQDNQEKIRNYIIQEYQDHGIQHVTLGGDVEHIPYRGFYCTVQSSSVYESNDIPADLYYCALDGTWNDDGDNNWGEIGEDDLLPEIGIGRFSVTSQTEFDALMNKTLMYQESPVEGELANPFLVGEHLYSNPETWGSDYLELLIGYREDNGYTTNGIPEDQDIEKLYASEGSWSSSTLMNQMNQGTSFIHHVGHANSNYAMKFYNSDITNANFSGVDGITHNYALIYSHGCICGAFDDNDCIAEKMIGIENLAVAVYMNSRYGWFNEGQTEGPAAHINRELVDAFYNEKEAHLGMAYTIARIATAPWVTAPGQWEEGALRWNFYDCNLLGDACVRFWSDEPTDITTTYQNALPIGVPSLSISVAGSGNLEGLYCNFMMNGTSYGVAQTNASGQAEIVFNEPITELGDAMLYVSGYNTHLHEYPVTVIPNNGAYVVYASSEINDASGNNNGEADYTESILLSTTLENVGTVQADDVTATLTTSDPYVTITDDSENFGNIPGGATVSMEDAFAFDIAGDIPDQHAVAFTVTADGQDTWSSEFSITVNAPELAMDSYYFNDAVSGNNNGILDPGETADLIISAMNNGHADAYDVSALLTTGDEYITINTTSQQSLGNLTPSQSSDATFSVTADGNVPAGHTSVLECTMEASFGIVASEEILVPFTDYCEATTSTEDEYIARVEFGSIDNSSGWQGSVADYTDQLTELEPGASEEITITNGNAWSSDMVTVWIDWNANKELGDEANETFELTNVGGNGEVFEGTITVPQAQMAANYRMRVRMTYSSAPQPCGSSSYGEVEDYTLVVAGGALSVYVTCTPEEICQGGESQMQANVGGGSGSYEYQWTPSTGLNNPNIANPIASPEETTEYTVEVFDGMTSVSEQVTLIVHELPETPFIYLEGETLYSDAAEGNQWYDSQGPIAGATGQTYTCIYEDVYHVKVTNGFGCESDPSNSIHVVVAGIGEIAGEEGLRIFPNPFNEVVNISFRLEQGTQYKLAIFNAIGQEVITVSDNQSATGEIESCEVSAASLEKGIYFCKLIAGNEVTIQKMIHTK